MVEGPPATSDTNPPIEQTAPAPAQDRNQRSAVIGIVVVVVLIVLITVGSFVLLYKANPLVTAQIRDIFIIYLALQSLLIGLVLIILIVQMARLINLIQNELRPILDSTNETISTLRGTSTFLSENMVEPVIKMNEYMAAITRLLILLGLVRRGKKE